MRNSLICLRHFTQDDYIRSFSFVEEVTNKPFMSRLTRDEIEITAVPSVHAEAVTKTLVVTEIAKRCLERAIGILIKCFELVDLSLLRKKSF